MGWSYDNNVYAFGQTDDGPALQGPEPPDLRTLQPDFTLKPSQPVAKLPSSDND